MNTVIGLFDSFTEAQNVIKDLIRSGFKWDVISIAANDPKDQYATFDKSSDKGSDTAKAAATGSSAGLLARLATIAVPGIGPVVAKGPLTAAMTGAAADGLIDALTNAGVPKEQAQDYAEGVRRGGILVTVEATDNMVDRAAEIMRRYDIIDLDKRAAEWRQSGWTGHNKAEPSSDNEPNRERDPDYKVEPDPGNAGDGVPKPKEGEVTVPVMEEELQIDKRQVKHGGVRLKRYVTETPVEQSVQLREERIKVDRRPADRLATEADFASFEEGRIEIIETFEEVVVSKRARVVEEVVVAKEVIERTEIVRDKVRRSNVEVEKMAAEPEKNKKSFDDYGEDFRKNYNDRFSNSEYTYEQYAPAYRYGYNLANDKRYSSGDWAKVERDARRYWEESNEGTWQEFKDAVHYAWHKVRLQR